jgi:hypothetical protein
MAEFRTVFVSYSWDSDDHKNWVRQLAERLVSNGVHVHLDQWDVQYGESLAQFMEEKIPESDFVLIICTPSYATKSKQRQGGVGYEAQIVSARIAASIARSKFVPIIRSGGLRPNEADCAIPPHFQGILTIDMRQDAQYAAMFENLLCHIDGQSAVTRPPLGNPPNFDTPVKQSQTVRLASFAIEHWELESGMVMNEQYPKTFRIPDEAVRRALKPGNIVKLMFNYSYPDDDGIYSERMWVEITELNGPYFVGRLRNGPAALDKRYDLEFDSQVVFLPEHVLDVYEDKPRVATRKESSAEKGNA